MKATIYDTTTGEILRSTSGPPEGIDKIVTDAGEAMLRSDTDFYPDDTTGYVIDPDAGEWVDKALADAKADRISQVKADAQAELAKTDWYVIRRSDTGKSVPQDVLTHRQDVRNASDSFETEINALSDTQAVYDYNYTIPTQ